MKRFKIRENDQRLSCLKSLELWDKLVCKYLFRVKFLHKSGEKMKHVHWVDPVKGGHRHFQVFDKVTSTWHLVLLTFLARIDDTIVAKIQQSGKYTMWGSSFFQLTYCKSLRFEVEQLNFLWNFIEDRTSSSIVSSDCCSQKPYVEKEDFRRRFRFDRIRNLARAVRTERRSSADDWALIGKVDHSWWSGRGFFCWVSILETLPQCVWKGWQAVLRWSPNNGNRGGDFDWSQSSCVQITW